MTISICSRIILGCAAGLLFAFDAYAVDLNGAWANDVSVCSKIFEKKNNRISMTHNADFFGSGFIIEGDEVRGMLGACRITGRKQEGDATLLQAQCATGVVTTLRSARFTRQQQR